MNPNPNASHALPAEISAHSEASTEISSERLQKSGFDFDALSPRTVIRGESLKKDAEISHYEKSNRGVIIDWFRFTFLPLGNMQATVDIFKHYFKQWFDFSISIVPSDKGFRGYETSFDITAFLNGESVRLGILAFGGSHVGNTVLVDLSGTGTAPVSDWQAVYSSLQDLKARITRCDLALDFLNGEVTFEDLKGLYSGGDFNSGGRIPNYREISSGNSSKMHCEGRTLEIGKRTNGKLFRGYEKGKQLGNQESEWLRLEVELGSRDREIPHDVVLRPNEYFAGAHKALASILSQFHEVTAEAIKTHQKAHETTLAKVLGHIKHQYGKYINVAIPQFHDIAATPTDTKLQTPKPIAGAPSPSSNSGQNNTGSASTSSPSPFSAEWRVVGSFKGSSGVWVVVQDSKGRSRLESPTVFNEPNSVLAIGTIDGQRVSAFSGASTTKEISK